LGIPLNDKLAQQIADKYSPEAMKKRKEKHHDNRHANPDAKEDAALPSIPALKFATSGHWRDHLTDEEAAMVVKANGHFFERFGYGL
jgi:hypothetical protein